MGTRSWLLAVSIASVAITPAHASNLSFNTWSDQDGSIESCSDLEMEFTSDWKHDVVTVRRSQTVSIAWDVKQLLKVEASDRGGVRVQPAVDGKFSALVCMAAGATSNSAGEKLLDQLEIVSSGGVLRVNGPDNDDWAAIIVLSVPAGSTLDLTATNGPLRVGDVEGRFTLRAENGPIKLSRVGGVVDARTQNGPIKFHGHAGDVMLTTQNGPIALELDANEWDGKRLDASTQNGPLKLSLPDDMKTGVDVTGSRWMATRWNGMSLRNWAADGGPRRYHFGGSPTLIRISTVNGPMKIFGPTSKKTSRGTEI